MDLMATGRKTAVCRSETTQVRELLNAIALTWRNFARNLSPQEKNAMQATWGACLNKYPLDTLKMAIALKNSRGQKWPPTSPGELIEWADDVQRVINNAEWLADSLGDIGFDPAEYKRMCINADLAKLWRA